MRVDLSINESNTNQVIVFQLPNVYLKEQTYVSVQIFK